VDLYFFNIQGDSGGKINTLGGDGIGHCEKTVSINICLILNGYRDRAVCISRPNCFRYFMGFG
jgi:hypothetical protein